MAITKWTIIKALLLVGFFLFLLFTIGILFTLIIGGFILFIISVLGIHRQYQRQKHQTGVYYK